MANIYGRSLKWGGAAAVTALAALLVLLPPPLVNPSAMGAPMYGDLMLPMAAGLVVLALLSDRRRRLQLDERARLALEGHSMPYELTWLVLLLVLFLASTLAASFFAELVLPELSWEVMMPPVRILFLFVLPLAVVDMGGFTVAGYSTVMPIIAMRVTEGWRWAGLVVIGAVLGLMVLSVFPAPLPDATLLVAATIAVVASVAVPEEIFFRALVQTRLERVAGRWPGILLSTVLFTAVSVFLTEFGDISEESQMLRLGIGLAVLYYFAVGLLHGYLWTCYRNIWLNVLLRTGTVMLRVAPVLLVV